MPRPARRRRLAIADRLEPRTLFAFGLTTTATSYVVDTGGGLVFTVLRAGTVSSTVHLGDLTSAVYAGTETLAPYSQTARYSHYEQGLTAGAVVTATVDPGGQWIKITADDSAASSGGVIQYYVAHRGDPDLYMASLPTDVTNGPGEGRFIAYMNHGVFTHVEDASDISTTNASVEGSDVYYNTTTGITKSKFYNTRRIIDNPYHGITGTGIGAFMFTGNREHGAGGPFFKDIDFQTTSAASTEMYDALFTGHEQTEAFRQGLQGPYAIAYTNGATPVAPDYAFLDAAGIAGLVPASGRGGVAGSATGVPAGHQTVVALANGAAQYWAYADATTGAYAIAGVLPGTYAETIYDTELAVGTRTVTVTAGATTAANLVDAYYTPAAIWRIGTWDGTPLGFLNADKIYTMHPSDVRMAPFTVANDATARANNYVIGTNAPADFPLAEFMSVNNDTRITFSLTAAQAAQPDTLRIGITDAFAGGRPNVTVDAGTSTAWTSAIQSPSSQPDSRSITRGTWRGNNVTFSYAIPAGKLVAGTNTIDLPVVSGSSGSTVWLSPSVVFDAIDLVPTAALTNAPVVAALRVAPANATVLPGRSQAFVAAAYDQFGNPIPANVTWSAVNGTIDQTGTYTAPTTATTDTVTATVGGVSGSVSVLTVPTTFPASAGDGFYLRLAPDGTTDQLWVAAAGAPVGPATGAAPTYSVPLSALPSLTFGPGSAADGSLTVDATNGSPVPAGGIGYDGGGGTDTFALIGTAAADTVTVGASTVRLGTGGVVTLANVEAAAVTLGAGADTLVQSAQPVAALTWADPTSADALVVTGGAFRFPAPTAPDAAVAVGRLTVTAGASVALATSPAAADRSVLVVSSALSIVGGTLDLGANDLIIRSGALASGLVTATGLLRSGFAGGAWTGPGIDSGAVVIGDDTALGVAAATGAAFDAQATAAGDVLVKYTRYGDTNLDGVVNAGDYTRLDVGFVTRLSGWANGDFNYDGTIDGSDYTLADDAFNRQPTPTATAAAVVAQPAVSVAVRAAVAPSTVPPPTWGEGPDRKRKPTVWRA